MALYDIDGTATGGSSISSPALLVELLVAETLVGSAVTSTSTQVVLNMSGFVVGAGALIDARLLDVAGLSVSSGVATANLVRSVGLSGFTFGGGQISLSVPEPIFGVAMVTAYMDVICVPPPICPTRSPTSFRWGHVFTHGDLAVCIQDGLGNPVVPVCVSYTMYKIVQGCQPIQVGASGRKPASSSLGCYYATGTAGECGQPGVWLIQWNYQRTFGDPMVQRDCYFLVLDSILWPMPGDTLQRQCKYGWGE